MLSEAWSQCKHKLSQKHTYPHTHNYRFTPAHICKHRHTHTHTCTHTHTHTLTQTISNRFQEHNIAFHALSLYRWVQSGLSLPPLTPLYTATLNLLLQQTSLIYIPSSVLALSPVEDQISKHWCVCTEQALPRTSNAENPARFQAGWEREKKEQSYWFRNDTFHPPASPSKKAHESGQPLGDRQRGGSDNEPNALEQNT